MKGRYQGTSEEASEQSPDGNAGKEGEMKKEAKEGIEKYTVHFSPVITRNNLSMQGFVVDRLVQSSHRKTLEF